MMRKWTLKSISMENFKSYRRVNTIEPFHPFTAIIGPNGSGKSNLMDAISFVMGEKPTNMRAKKLADFIYGASVSEPISRTASVTAVFTDGNGTDRKFQRIASAGSGEYRIDDKSVSAVEYSDVLEREFNINVKAKNFLVYQGYIEQIAMKSPKEMTQIFEEISGSGVHKDDYDRLRKEMLKIQEEVNDMYQKKKGMNAERREAKLEKEEAEKYNKILKDFQRKQIDYQLACLYYNEKETEDIGNELLLKRNNLKKLEEKKLQAEESVKIKKREQGEISRQIAKLEQDIREKELKIDKKKPQFISLKERLSYMKQKCETSRKNLIQAEKASEDHKREIEQLEKELSDAERELEVFDAETTRELSERNRHLESRHIAEYHKLKSEAERKSAKIMQVIDSINREQKADQDRLDEENSKISELKRNKSNKENTLNDLRKRVEKINERIESTNQSIIENERKKSELDDEVKSSKGKMERLQKKLESIVEQLGDAKTDKHEDARRKKKQEIVEKFKSKFPGVYDRMLNLCQPIHNRYNVAVTKVLGKFMEAIVVDNEETARQCIQILKEQMLEPETFLPLETLQVRSLKQRLRTITSPKGVKLVYDVLQFSPKAIERAVLFATNNALVAEDPDDAAKVAYESRDGQYDVVALDGTFYQKSGIISGGSLDLAKKAKRWDEKQMNTLKAEKERLTEELREEMKKSRKESELNTLDQQINGLKSRLKFAQADYNSLINQIRSNEDDIKKIDREIEQLNPRISEVTQSMEKRISLIEKHKFDKDKVEDEVFKNFCREINVENIRQFEERDLKNQETRKAKRFEFEVIINRINNNLEFQKSRDILTNVNRWKDIVNSDEINYKNAQEEEEQCRNEIENGQEAIKELEMKKSSFKKKLDTIEVDLSKCRKELGSIVKDVQNVQKQIISMDTRLDSKKNERLNILKNAKIEKIEIPFSNGSLNDIEMSTQASSDQSELNSQMSSYNNIEINYSSLPDTINRLRDKDEIKKCIDNMEISLKRLRENVTKMQPPNSQLEQRLNDAQGRYMSTNEEFESLKKKDRTCKTEFEKVKEQRRVKFMALYDRIVEKIDGIYKDLAQSRSAQAFLNLENPEEPFLEGVIYNCVAPGKRFQQMANLSGGEKTLAALALLFAIQANHPAPFLLLDEIDAALDGTNINKVKDFIKKITHRTQIIVISLKPEFFTFADALIGISPQSTGILSSGVYTLDLTKIEE